MAHLLLIPAGIFVAGAFGYKLYTPTPPTPPPSKLYLSKFLDGKTIGGWSTSDLPSDDEIITEYYVPSSTTVHGFVVCKTAAGSFITQLMGGETHLEMMMILIPWEPSVDTRTDETSMTVKEFKDEVTKAAVSFGSYALESNDCRHFSTQLVNALKNKKVENI